MKRVNVASPAYMPLHRDSTTNSTHHVAQGVQLIVLDFYIAEYEVLQGYEFRVCPRLLKVRMAKAKGLSDVLESEIGHFR